MGELGKRGFGRLFEQVPELYDRVRPGYPEALFDDLAALTSLGAASSVLEIGCGTGKATTSLAARGCRVTALEPGAELAVIARRTVPTDRVTIEVSTFEDWDPVGERFDVVAAASAWHWVDPAVGWPKAHTLLRPGGWLAVMGHVVVRRPDEPETYERTADLHEHYAPGDAAWRSPPWEGDVLRGDDAWGAWEDTEGWFEEPVVRRYPMVQWFDGAGFAALLGTQSIYLRLDDAVREPLLARIAERVRTTMGDRVSRRYVTHLAVGRRRDRPVRSSPGCSPPATTPR